jgi:hypothetical protein
MRAMRVGLAVITACLLLAAGAGCTRAKCTSSAECQGGQICGAPGKEAFQCLRACMSDMDCGGGTVCGAVTGADCTECGEGSASACVPGSGDADADGQ